MKKSPTSRKDSKAATPEQGARLTKFDVIKRMQAGLYMADPAQWVPDALGMDLDEWQKNAMRLLFKGGKNRLAVAASHGTGKSILTAIITHFFMMNFLPSKTIITGPCVEENEKILLADGRWVRVKDLSGRYFGVLAVKNDLTFQPALANAFPNGIKPVFRLKTRSGRQALRTGNHPFRTLSGWTPLIDLKPGDFVGVPLELPAYGKRQMPAGDVKILAYLISEGCTTDLRYGHLQFAQNPGAVLEEMRECVSAWPCKMNAMGPRQYAIVGTVKTEGGRPINPLKEFCREHGMDGRHSYEKQIPPDVWELDNESLKIFLSRLFAGDGYVRGDGGVQEVGYCSTSRELIDDVNRLILRFDIAGRIRAQTRGKVGSTGKGKRDLHYWYVCGPDAVRFAQEIGVFNKDSAIERLLGKELYRSRSPLFDTLPPPVLQQTIQCLREADVPITRLGILKTSRNIGRPTVQRAAHLLKNGYLETISQEHIGWDEVVSVEYVGDRMTYGIEVEKYHTYVTDFLEHNTGKQTRSQAWSYLENVWSRSVFKDDIAWYKTKMYIRGADESIFALWLTSKEPKSIEGFHGPADGRNLLWIVEEAKGVEDPVFEAIQGALSHKDNYLYISSTCGGPRGYFFRCFHDKRALWHTMKVPYTESTRISPEQVQKWKDQWGEFSPIFRARAMAEFPDESDNVLVPLSFLERAVVPVDDEYEENARMIIQA